MLAVNSYIYIWIST